VIDDPSTFIHDPAGIERILPLLEPLAQNVHLVIIGSGEGYMRHMYLQVCMSKQRSKGPSVFFSILVVSFFAWSAAIDSSGVLLSYSITSLAWHITTILILISTLLNI
jgi:hypothetical protein